MFSDLRQIGRTVVHAPRRFFYAFLWATSPPEALPNRLEGTAAAAIAGVATDFAIQPPCVS